MDIKREIISKINKILKDEKLELSEQELKYIIKIWVIENYPEHNVNDIKFYHYSDEGDPQEKEKIGARILI
jgi:hypothetical protein